VTWPRRLLLLFTGLVLASALLLAGMVVFSGESAYKQAVAWIADRIFDSTLVINGPLSVQFSNGLVVDAGDVRLDAHDDSYHFSSHLLQADIRLKPMLSGTVWLNALVVKQMHLQVNETTSDTFEWQDLAAVPVIIASANFENLVIEYRELPPGTLHRFTLNELLLNNIDDSGPTRVHANGLFEGKHYQVSGTLPSVNAVLDPEQAKPVDLLFTSGNDHLHVAGSITDPLNGKGMDLQLGLESQNTTELLELLGDNIPDVGDLQFSAMLRGDYAAPRLEDIDAQLQRGEQVDITARGLVDNIFTGKGLNLRVDGHSSQPEVASWLLFHKLDQMKSLEFKGTVQEEDGHFKLADIDATARTQAGLVVSAQGNAELYHASHLFLKSDSGIRATFSAPTTASLNLLNMVDIPELGAVSGNFRLLVSTDDLGLYDADVKIGSKGNSSARLQGRVSNIPLDDVAAATGIDLQLSVQSPDIATLARKWNFTLPATGHGTANAHIVGDLPSLKMKRVHIRAEDEAGLQITARGNVDRLVLDKAVKLDRALFDITAAIRDFGKLSGLTGIDFPKRLPANMSSTLSLNKSELAFNDFQINIGRPKQPVVRLQGKVITQLQKGSSIHVNYNVAVADLVAAYTDTTPGYLGRLQGDANISDIDGSWGIEKFNLVSSQTSLYHVNIHGGFDDLKNSDQVDIKVDIEVTDPAGLGTALGVNLAGLKTHRIDGQFNSTQNAIVYNGTVKVGTTSATTTLHGSTYQDEPYFSGRIHIPVLDLTDFGFRLEQDAEHEVLAKPASSGKDYLFSRELLDVSFLNNFGLDLQIDIDEIESYGETSIDSFTGHAALQDGALKMDPLRLVYADGTMNILFDLQASEPPAYALKVIADDLILGPTMAQLQNNTPIKGRANVKLDINSEGNSAHELASNLGGIIDIEYENARIPAILVDYLSVDVFGWAFSKTVDRQKYINLNCVLTHFTASSGELKSKLLVADGPNMSIGGRIDLNLRDETISAVLLPKQKKRLFSTITPVELSGPIKDPHVLAIPAQAAIQEIGAIALSPTIYLSTRLLEKIWSKIKSHDEVGEGCVNIEKLTDKAEKASKQGHASQNPHSGDLLSD